MNKMNNRRIVISHDSKKYCIKHTHYTTKLQVTYSNKYITNAWTLNVMLSSFLLLEITCVPIV
uniref:Uncharacterized protein n=1 Tax=Arion vulgaris TaxID=1028688 RepID=A0A0B7APY1_9EUPU